MAAVNLAELDPPMRGAVERSRKLLKRRALAGAAAGAVPIPGLDWLVDTALLSKLLPAINAEFGLTPQQISRLPPSKREQVEQAVGKVGSLLVGKLISQKMIVRAARVIGVRLAAGQAAKVVPLAGQIVSAAVSYSAIRYLGEAHIRDCIEVCRQAHLQLPAPPA